jgi:hypothetical protein
VERKSRKNKKRNPEVEGEIFDENGDPVSAAPPLESDEPELSAAPPPEPVNFDETAEPEPEPEPRTERRGRPRGSKNGGTGRRGKSAEAAEKSVENLSNLIREAHGFLAGLTNMQELLLTQEESQQYGRAVHDVEALYGEVKWITPEARAWGKLGLTAVMIYWPRYVAIKRRLAAEAKGENKAPIEVHPINRPAASAATH